MRLFLCFALVLLAGCSGKARGIFKAKAAVAENHEDIAEKSRQYTTGALDSLRYAPTNKPTNLAKTLLTWDQQLEGVPLTRLDVEAILADNRASIRALSNSFAEVQQLILDRERLATELNEKQEKLLQLGALYEEERNRNIVKRVWRWSVATFGIGGIIALLFFFPFLIPIGTRIVGWIVGMFPKLAGFFGVVLTKSFDAVVKGVQAGKKKIDANKGATTVPAPEPTVVLGDELSKATDKSDRNLIDARKEVLANDGEIPPIAKVIG